MQSLSGTRDFDEVLVESIEETLSSLFSREVVNALYYYLQKVHSIQKEEIPHRLETLFSTLERTFGHQNSKTIGRAIARTLYTKLGLPFYNNPTRTVIEYIREAKIKLQEGEIQV